jgi:hypothetical protein
MSGTTSQHSPEEWLSVSGSEALATEDEMSLFSSASNAMETSTLEASETVALLPWSSQEELLVPCTPFGNPAHNGPASSPLRKVMLFLAMGSLALGVAQMFKGAQGAQPKVGKKDMDNGKYFV